MNEDSWFHTDLLDRWRQIRKSSLTAIVDNSYHPVFPYLSYKKW